MRNQSKSCNYADCRHCSLSKASFDISTPRSHKSPWADSPEVHKITKYYQNLLRDVMTFPTISNVEERRPDDAIVAENKSRAYPPLLSLFQVVGFCSWKQEIVQRERLSQRRLVEGFQILVYCAGPRVSMRIGLQWLRFLRWNLPYGLRQAKKRRNFGLSICLHLVLDASCGFLVSSVGVEHH